MNAPPPSRIEWLALDADDHVVGRVTGANRSAALASARQRWGTRALRVQSLASWTLSEEQRYLIARDRVIRDL